MCHKSGCRVTRGGEQYGPKGDEARGKDKTVRQVWQVIRKGGHGEYGQCDRGGEDMKCHSGVTKGALVLEGQNKTTTAGKTEDRNCGKCEKVVASVR